MALLAITSFTFILVCVPDPVCQTLRGKWSLSFPDITSFAALIIIIVGLGPVIFLNSTLQRVSQKKESN